MALNQLDHQSTCGIRESDLQILLMACSLSLRLMMDLSMSLIIFCKDIFNTLTKKKMSQ